MARRSLNKSMFIIFLVLFSVMLILPTVGEKKLEILFKGDATAKQIEEVKKKFSTDDFKIESGENKIVVYGTDITAATMNGVKAQEGVKNTRFKGHWAEQYLLAKKINLGLDLQGGMHLVLRSNFHSIEKKQEKRALNELLAKKKRALTEIEKADIKKSSILSEDDKTEITKQALEILRNRVDKFGVSEPSIRPRGNEAIEIQLPGVKDPKSVKKALGATGTVQYRLVNDENTKKVDDWLKNNMDGVPFPTDNIKLDNLSEKIRIAIKLPSTFELLYLYKRDLDSKKLVPGSLLVLENKVSLAGDDIKTASIGRDERGGFKVDFKTTAEGASKFAIVTRKENTGRRLAIVIDGKVRSAPSINSQIAGGSAEINGDFTRSEAQALTRIIKEGALPVDLEIIEERTVGPSLGQDAIDSGVTAIKVGLLGVMIFMLIYYKFAGFIANIGLVLNMVFMLALLSWMGFTLTLPGIAGFILTVGMAVDANVIIFERIKEEIKNGKSVRMSIVHGFDKAFWTIFDANLTTLIAAFILYNFGTGPIKGFAVTLLIGILCSMFASLFVTRHIYEIISLNKKNKKLSI